MVGFGELDLWLQWECRFFHRSCLVLNHQMSTPKGEEECVLSWLWWTAVIAGQQQSLETALQSLTIIWRQSRGLRVRTCGWRTGFTVSQSHENTFCLLGPESAHLWNEGVDPSHLSNALAESPESSGSGPWCLGFIVVRVAVHWAWLWEPGNCTAVVCRLWVALTLRIALLSLWGYIPRPKPPFWAPRGLLPHSPRTHSAASVARVAHCFSGVEICFPLHPSDRRQRIIIFKRNIIRPFLRVTFVFSKRSINILLSLRPLGSVWLTSSASLSYVPLQLEGPFFILWDGGTQCFVCLVTKEFELAAIKIWG